MFRERYPIAWAFHASTVRAIEATVDGADEEGVPASPPVGDAPPLKQLPPSPFSGDADPIFSSTRMLRREAIPLASVGGILQEGCRAKPVHERGVDGGLHVHVIARRVEQLTPGIYEYAPAEHAVRTLGEGMLSDPLVAQLFLGNGCAASAAAIVVLSVEPLRLMRGVGDRGYRYGLLEVGQAVERINRACGAAGLAGVNLGGFHDVIVGELLKCRADEVVPLCGVAIGRAASERP